MVMAMVFHDDYDDDCARDGNCDRDYDCDCDMLRC